MKAKGIELEEFKQYLVKEPLPVQEELEELNSERVRLAQQCSEILGYRALADEVNKVRVETSLDTVLRELHLEPFSEDSVTQYKSKTLKHLNRRGLIYRTLSGLGIVLGFVLLLGECYIVSVSPGARESIPLIMMIGVPLIIISLVINLEAKGMFWQWNHESLENYSSILPEAAKPALQRALAIKEKLPESKFYIEYLNLNQRPALDPFLMVEAGERKYYIGVWDEKQFFG